MIGSSQVGLLLNGNLLWPAGGAQAWRGETSQTASTGPASTSSASNGSGSGAKAAQPAVSSSVSCAAGLKLLVLAVNKGPLLVARSLPAAAHPPNKACRAKETAKLVGGRLPRHERSAVCTACNESLAHLLGSLGSSVELSGKKRHCLSVQAGGLPPRQQAGGARRAGVGEAQTPLDIVFVSAEVAPWSKTGGLGDVVGSAAHRAGRARAPRHGRRAQARLCPD